MGERNLDSVLNLEPGWTSALAAPTDLAREHREFKKEHAVGATIAYFAGRLSASEAQEWAAWLTNRPDISVVDPQLLEFLGDWSAGVIAIDDESVDVWQSRLAHD